MTAVPLMAAGASRAGAGGCASAAIEIEQAATSQGITRDIRTSVIRRQDGQDGRERQDGRCRLETPFRPAYPAYPADPALSCVQLPPCIQAIKVQHRVEDEKVTALGFAAPDGIVREDDDVPFVERHIDDGRVLRDLAAVLHKT